MPGNRRGGIIGTLLVGFAVFCGLSIFAVAYLASHVRVRESYDGRNTVRLETPVGTMTVRHPSHIDPALVGIPIYPGATLNHSKDHNGALVDFDGPTDSTQFSLVAAQYETPDSADRVVDFYRQKFPHWIITTRHEGDRDHVRMEYSHDGYKRFIVVEERDGRTEIALASLGEAASN